MGGVGGVFPPVITESPKVSIKKDHHKKQRENDDTSRIYSNIGIPTRDDSTCIYGEELYNAGEMVRFLFGISARFKSRCNFNITIIPSS